MPLTYGWFEMLDPRLLDPADVKGPDYPSETFRVLKEREIRYHGENRTRCLVSEAWDRIGVNGAFTSIGM
jgi:hypothetical protein